MFYKWKSPFTIRTHQKEKNRSKYLVELGEDYEVQWKKSSENRILFEDNHKVVWLFGNLGGKQNLKNFDFFTLEDHQMKATNYQLPHRPIAIGLRKMTYHTKTDNFWYFDNKNLLVFHPSRGLFYDFNITHQEIGNSEVHDIFFDNQENAWVATAFGLYKVKLKKIHFKNYWHYLFKV